MARPSRGWLLTAALGSSLLVLAGCATSPASVPSTAAPAQTATAAPLARASVDAATVRGPGLSVDFDASPTVSGVVARNDVAFSGTVTGWIDGRMIESGPASQYKTQIVTAILVVVVDASYGSTTVSETAYVQVVRGMSHSDSSGELDPSLSTARTVADLETAVPAGVRVTVIGSAAATDKALAKDGDVITPSAQLPPTADLYQVDPQGLLFEDADGTYVSGYAPESDVIVGTWPGSTESDVENSYDALLLALRGSATS